MDFDAMKMKNIGIGHCQKSFNNHWTIIFFSKGSFFNIFYFLRTSIITNYFNLILNFGRGGGGVGDPQRAILLKVVSRGN